jgi:hypothetical protein
MTSGSTHTGSLRGPFRPFQYPTVPLCVSSDFRTRTLRAALDATMDASLRPERRAR